jgi:hypothetical protein
MNARTLNPRTLGRANVLLVGSTCAPAAGPLEVVCSREGWDLRIDRAPSVNEAIRSLRARGADLVVVDFDCLGTRGRWMALAARLAQPNAATIAVGERPSASSLKSCLRAGVAEWVDAEEWTVEDALIERLCALLTRAVTQRVGADRITVLESACRRLSEERASLQKQLGGACASLAGAEDAIRDREAIAAMQAECRTLFAQETESEAIVELAANYIVSRVGPTNAALLVGDGERYRLAAYVRDDMARRSAGGIIEHISSQWASCIAAESEPIVINEGRASHQGFEGLIGVLPGRAALAFAGGAGSGAQARACVALFRDAARPFGPSDTLVAKAVGGALQDALERTDRILNRAKPGWPTESPEPGEA